MNESTSDLNYRANNVTHWSLLVRRPITSTARSVRTSVLRLKNKLHR